MLKLFDNIYILTEKTYLNGTLRQATINEISESIKGKKYRVNYYELSTNSSHELWINENEIIQVPLFIN